MASAKAYNVSTNKALDANSDYFMQPKELAVAGMLKLQYCLCQWVAHTRD